MNSIKGLLNSSGSYSLTYNLPYWFYKFTNKYHMGDISDTAQTRLGMIEFYHQVREVTVVCRSFNISRKTFYKWLNRYEQSGRRLSSLENQRPVPHTKRRVSLTFDEEMKIKHLRQQYLRLGKKKLQILYQNRYGLFVSQHHIQHVIQKYNLYYDPAKAKTIRSKKMRDKGAKKIRINEVNPRDYLTEEKPFFFCCDTI